MSTVKPLEKDEKNKMLKAVRSFDEQFQTKLVDQFRLEDDESQYSDLQKVCLRRVGVFSKGMPRSKADKALKRSLVDLEYLHRSNALPKPSDYFQQLDHILLRYEVSRDPTHSSKQLEIDAPGKPDYSHELLALIRDEDPRLISPLNRPRYLAGTRTDVLRDLLHWADGHPASTTPQICWVQTDVGKLELSMSFADQLTKPVEKFYPQGRLGASLFYPHSSFIRNKCRNPFPTLAYKLATSNNPASKAFRDAVLDFLKTCKDIDSLPHETQFYELVVKPAERSQMDAIIVIDGTDGFENHEEVKRTILSLLSYATSLPLNSGRIRIFLTSRDAPTDYLPRKESSSILVDSTKLLKICKFERTTGDIRKFLGVELAGSDSEIGNTVDVSKMLDEIAQCANGSFDFASVALPFALQKPPEHVQEGNWSRCKSLSSLGQDDLYQIILRDAHARDGNSLYKLLGLLVVARRPLTHKGMATLLGLELGKVKSILKSLGPVLSIPADDDSSVIIRHRSFLELFSDVTRLAELHCWIAERCFNLMKPEEKLKSTETDKLKANMYGSPRYAMNPKLDTEGLNSHLDEATRYCCRHWFDHFLSATETYSDIPRYPELIKLLNDSFPTWLLHWIEALGLLGDSAYAIRILNNLEVWLINMKPKKCKNLKQYVPEGRRLLSRFSDMIDASVRHMYHSALPLSPNSCQSWTPTHSAGEAKLIIGFDPSISPLNGRSAATSADSKKAEGHHSQRITSLDVSYDGALIVSGSEDKTARVWAMGPRDGDAGAGKQSARRGHVQRVFRGHESPIEDVLFLRSNSRIVSVDRNNKMIIWSHENGQVVWSNPSKLPYEARQSLHFLYPHDDEGFLSFPSTTWGTLAVYCWTFHDDELVVVAQSSLPELSNEHIESVYYDPQTSGIDLILDYGSNEKLLKAPWQNALQIDSTPPTKLERLRPGEVSRESATDTRPKGHGDAVVAREQSSDNSWHNALPVDSTSPTKLERLRFQEVSKGTATYTGRKGHGDMVVACRQSSDNCWILGKDDQKILWLPSEYRGWGYWDQWRLIMAGYNGLLTVIDFEGVDVELDHMPAKSPTNPVPPHTQQEEAEAGPSSVSL